METKWLKPAPELKVRYEDPSRGFVRDAGEELPLTKYYRRRLRDGDLVEGPPEDGAAAPAAGDPGAAPEGDEKPKGRGSAPRPGRILGHGNFLQSGARPMRGCRSSTSRSTRRGPRRRAEAGSPC